MKMMQVFFAVISMAAIQRCETAESNAKLPIIECSAVLVHGCSGHSYIPPMATDTISIDLNEINNGGLAMLEFKSKEGRTYIPIEGEFKPIEKDAEKNKRDDSINVWERRYISDSGKGSKVTMDVVRMADKNKYEIYIVIEDEGITHGVIVLEGNAKK
jgi:hypothetical protein